MGFYSWDWFLWVHMGLPRGSYGFTPWVIWVHMVLFVMIFLCGLVPVETTHFRGKEPEAMAARTERWLKRMAKAPPTTKYPRFSMVNTDPFW